MSCSGSIWRAGEEEADQGATGSAAERAKRPGVNYYTNRQAMLERKSPNKAAEACLIDRGQWRCL